MNLGLRNKRGLDLKGITRILGIRFSGSWARAWRNGSIE